VFEFFAAVEVMLEIIIMATGLIFTVAYTGCVTQSINSRWQATSVTG